MKWSIPRTCARLFPILLPLCIALFYLHLHLDASRGWKRIVDVFMVVVLGLFVLSLIGKDRERANRDVSESGTNKPRT